MVENNAVSAEGVSEGKGYVDWDRGIADETFTKLAYVHMKDLIKKSYISLLLLSTLSTYLIGITIYAVNKAVEPIELVSFSANPSNKVERITAFREPKNTPAQAIKWAEYRTTQLLSLHFNKLREQMAARANLFIDDGFEIYRKVLNEHETAQYVLDNSLIITAVVSDVPRLVQMKTIKGKVHWLIEIPVKQTQYGANDSPRTEDLVAIVAVVEAERSEALSGLKIKTFDVKSRGRGR